MDVEATVIVLIGLLGPASVMGWPFFKQRRILVPWRIGNALLAEGRFAEAEAKFRETLAMASARFGVDHWRTSLHMNALALSLVGQNRLDDAQPLVDRALVVADAQKPLPHPDLALVFVGASIYSASRKDEARAQALLDRARREGRGSRHVHAAIERTVMLRAAQKGDEARAADAYSRVPNELLKERDVGKLARLALKLLHVGDARRADQCLRAALSVVTRVSSGEFAEAFYRGLLGEVLLREGHEEEARRELEQAAVDYDAIVGGSHPAAAPVLVALAELRAKMGDDVGARSACKRVLGLVVPATSPAEPYRAGASAADPLEAERDRARAVLARLGQST
jgi:tetratricopeptide (TPR) repeat protein